MDRYGYLVNPGEDYQLVGNPKKPWWLFGLAAVAFGIWLVMRQRQAPVIGKYMGRGVTVFLYPVTAPATELVYEGTDMPFGIVAYEPALPTYVGVDNNGVARLYTDDGRAGGLISKGGQVYFVTEEELNIALSLTRQMNRDILLAVVPYALAGPGYPGYVTSGVHIGESVYITLTGQIGRALNKIEGGELTYVPLDVIDQTPDIWSTYVKPGGF